MTPEQNAESMRKYFDALCRRWPKAITDGKQTEWFQCARSYIGLVESQALRELDPPPPTQSEDELQGEE